MTTYRPRICDGLLAIFEYEHEIMTDLGDLKRNVAHTTPHIDDDTVLRESLPIERCSINDS